MSSARFKINLRFISFHISLLFASISTIIKWFRQRFMNLLDHCEPQTCREVLIGSEPSTCYQIQRGPVNWSAPCSVCQTVRIITKNVHMQVTRLALSGMRTIDLQMIEAQQLIITYDSNPIINYFGPRKSRASYLLIKKMEDSWKNYYAAIISWD